MDKPIIIKCNYFNIRPDEIEKVRQLILKQMEDGVVILPSGFELAEVNVELLKQIKAEIGRIETEEGGDFLERPATDIIYEAQKIIEKHISELKGDNK